MKRIARFVYLAAAWLFLAGVATQVFLAGMAVVALRIGWSTHGELGHWLAGPLVLMLVSQYVGRLPRQEKQLTWLLFGVYVVQADVIIFLRFQAPVIAALHPVLALVDFALGVALARRAWPLIRQAQAPAGALTELETST